MIHLTIDGRTVDVEKGTTVLHAARKAGVMIPTLCYLENLLPDGSCRICVVEIENSKGRKSIDTACTAICAEGDVINTMSEGVIESRRNTLDLLLSDHKIDCFSCIANGNCKLRDLSVEYGLKESSYSGEKNQAAIDDSNPYFVYDPGKCILCHRCVNTCHEIVGRGAIDTMNRGFQSVIGAPFDTAWGESTCESCGNCVQACPTGALSFKNYENFRYWQVERVRTTCPHCAVGCQMDLLVKNGQIVGAEGADGPSNHGRLCVNGRFGSDTFVCSDERLTDPMIRDRETGEFRKASWEEALDLVASRFTAIRDEYGPDALAGFTGCRSSNEDIYMMQKMVRAAFGTNNVAGCADGPKTQKISDPAFALMPYTISEITQNSGVILVIGSGIEKEHPVLGMRLRTAPTGGTRLITAATEETDLSEKAKVSLNLKPGTTDVFVRGLIRKMIESGKTDSTGATAEQLENLKNTVEKYTPEYVAEICQLDPKELKEAQEMVWEASAGQILFCPGNAEEAACTDEFVSLCALAGAADGSGYSGLHVNIIRGKNNEQGAYDMGAIPAYFTGSQKVECDGTREKFEKAWGVKLNPEQGIPVSAYDSAIAEGKIRGMFIFGEDPDNEQVRRSLATLDFLVVNALYMTETAKLADVILPGCAYAEKEGTFTNTECRVQRIRKAVEASGNIRPDTDVFTDLMNRMGYPQPYLTAAQIMDEIASLTPSYAGITHARLDGPETEGQGLLKTC